MRDLALVLDAVRHQHELGVGTAPDRGEETGGEAALRVGQGVQPGLNVGLRRAGRIEIALFRFRGRARNECLVVIEARPWPFVDQKVVQSCAPECRRVLQQIQEHRLVAFPDLAKEQRVEHLGGFDHFRECPPFVLWKRCHVRGQVDGRESPRHGFEPLHGGV
jgi:hypothetical protein